MTQISTKCPICGSERHVTLYPSTFRADKDLNIKVFSARRLPDKIHGTIIRCRNCSLVRTLEVVSQDKLSKLYAQSLFNYHNLTQNLTQTYSRIIRDAVPSPENLSFLEVGCGNGFLLKEAIRLGFMKVAGIEPSIDAVGKAPAKIRKKIKIGSLTPDSFPPSSFDIIAAFQVFDHIPSPNQFLKIVYAILKPHGTLILMNHNVEALSAKIMGERSPIFDIEHPYLYSPGTITKILTKNKFKVQKIHSPTSIFDLRHLLIQLPIPDILKNTLVRSKAGILNLKINLKPGNLAVYAQK